MGESYKLVETVWRNMSAQATQDNVDGELVVDCPRCGATGDSYSDGENFERVDYGIHGPGTRCLHCNYDF